MDSDNTHIMPGDSQIEYAHKGYALTGKIMLSAIVILFGVVIFMVALHLYARWYLLRARRRNLRRGPRRAHIVFYVDSANPSAATVPRGLDATLLNSLPIFVYSSNTHPEPPECAVCLSVFEENEKGRTLPKCNHSFHTECIDMWFHSHSTCPICRSPVERVPVSQEMLQIVVSRDEPVESQPDSSSNMCQACRHDEGPSASTSSFGARRSELRGVSIDVPKRNQSFGRSDEEIGTGSPASQAFKSPGSRLLSFKRMLSRGLPSSPGNAPSRDNEPDIGRVDTHPSQVQTPKATESVMQ